METILVVDDARINRALARLALEEKGYRIVEAENGEDAIDLAKKEVPDLILMDIIMPKLNGLEASKMIKIDEKTKYIPIILVSAIEEFPIKKEGYQIGIDDYIVKPYKIEDLILRVEIILRVKREREKLLAQQKQLDNVHKDFVDSQSQIIEKEKEHLVHQIYVALHHEIRNPLTSILIGTQVLNSKFNEDSPEKKILEEVESCTKRIRDIMDSLGTMKNIIVDDYVMGTKMVNLRTSESESEEEKKKPE